MSFVRIFGRILPKKTRDRMHALVRYSTLKGDADSIVGWAITAAIVAGFFCALILSPMYDIAPLLVFTAVFTVFFFGFYIWLSLNVAGKAQTVEAVLPDALQLMASNIRAGLTTDKALLLAARPEFGALEEEIRRVGKETMAGRSLAESLSRMTIHIRSDDLDRTVELLVGSLRSGGQLADLLDETSSDIRDQQIIRKEISASVLMYVLFIFIAITIGAPLLFSMSSFLIGILTNNMAMIAKEMPANFDSFGGAAPIQMGGSQISGDFIYMYSLISMSLSAIFGGIIMGAILKGEEREGFKYVPVMLLIALILFHLGTWVLNSTLGGMMPTV
jgi:archaeal flagellar protein FlaJ